MKQAHSYRPTADFFNTRVVFCATARLLGLGQEYHYIVGSNAGYQASHNNSNIRRPHPEKTTYLLYLVLQKNLWVVMIHALATTFRSCRKRTNRRATNTCGLPLEAASRKPQESAFGTLLTITSYLNLLINDIRIIFTDLPQKDLEFQQVNRLSNHIIPTDYSEEPYISIGYQLS